MVSPYDWKLVKLTAKRKTKELALGQVVPPRTGVNSCDKDLIENRKRGHQRVNNGGVFGGSPGGFSRSQGSILFSRMILVHFLGRGKMVFTTASNARISWIHHQIWWHVQRTQQHCGPEHRRCPRGSLGRQNILGDITVFFDEEPAVGESKWLNCLN